jgi:hypothetical protein
MCEVKVALALQRAGRAETLPLTIAEAYAEGPTENYFNGYQLPSVKANWRTSRTRAHERQAAVYMLRDPLVLAAGDRLILTLTSPQVARTRVSVSPLGLRLPGKNPAPEILAAFAADQPTAEQRALLAGEYFKGLGQPAAAEFNAALQEFKTIAECQEGRASTVVTAATEPLVTRVLKRGDWQDESGEIVLPAPPGFLTAGAVKSSSAVSAPPARQTRLDLARWLTSRENPLTARTFVNRLWKQFFGNGLSGVVDDLGTQGEYPSHPELLDWLAVEFMDRKWDVKAIVRLIVTSATYRQSSTLRPELNELDPQNRLLARQAPRRLDAEFVRDNALAAAGLLDPAIGGPSAAPYQPEGYYAQLNFPLRDYTADTDERQYRRGVYTHWQRTFLHPMMANFDAPSREECTASRILSSTPQQALTLLNDPTFVEAARVLAEQVLQETAPELRSESMGGPDGRVRPSLPSNADAFASRLDFAFHRVLARPPTPRELASLEKFHTEQLAAFRLAPDDAKKFTAIGQQPVPPGMDRVELAAWTSVTRVLLNLNEAIVRY